MVIHIISRVEEDVHCEDRCSLSVQEGDTTFIVWTFHSKLYVVIHIISRVEQDAHLVFFSYADYIMHTSLPPGSGDGAFWSQCQFFKIFHVDICYNW